jgi:hypothetical protein
MNVGSSLLKDTYTRKISILLDVVHETGEKEGTVAALQRLDELRESFQLVLSDPNYFTAFVTRSTKEKEADIKTVKSDTNIHVSVRASGSPK